MNNPRFKWFRIKENIKTNKNSMIINIFMLDYVWQRKLTVKIVYYIIQRKNDHMVKVARVYPPLATGQMDKKYGGYISVILTLQSYDQNIQNLEYF